MSAELKTPWIPCRFLYPSDGRAVFICNYTNPDFLPRLARWIDGKWVGGDGVNYIGPTHWLPFTMPDSDD